MIDGIVAAMAGRQMEADGETISSVHDECMICLTDSSEHAPGSLFFGGNRKIQQNEGPTGLKAQSALLAGALKAHNPQYKIVYAKVMHG